MKVTLWGTRGSLASPGPETTRYGGNTSCVEAQGEDGSILILDAGTGIRRLGSSLSPAPSRVDILLTHLHMDHIQGLGFFAPLYNPHTDIHIWGPASTTQGLRERLMRYLSPPLFPLRLRELPRPPILHEVPCGDFEIGEFRIRASLVCHPGPTVGYRIADSSGVMVYLPDHEPALGVRNFPLPGDWTSGWDLAREADLLIHDCQFSAVEYPHYVGWGHSSVDHALAFAALARVKHFMPFHYDPSHTDREIDHLIEEAVARVSPPFDIIPGLEGTTFELSSLAQRGRVN